MRCAPTTDCNQLHTCNDCTASHPLQLAALCKRAPHNVRCTPSALHSAINLKPCHTFQALLSHSTLQSTAHGVQGGLAHCAQLHQIAINFVHFFDLSTAQSKERAAQCKGFSFPPLHKYNVCKCAYCSSLNFAHCNSFLCRVRTAQSENCAE